MNETNFYNRLGDLSVELYTAQTVRHERVIYDKMVALCDEYGDVESKEVLLKSRGYAQFQLRESVQNLYDSVVVSLPKPVRFFVKLLQRGLT